MSNLEKTGDGLSGDGAKGGLLKFALARLLTVPPLRFRLVANSMLKDVGTFELRM